MTSKTASSPSIAIIGNGWLGSALFQYWSHENSGKKVLLFSRSVAPEVTQLELDPHTKELPAELLGCEQIVYTLPPRENSEQYKKTLQNFVELLPKSKKLILISTTSVFENNTGKCTEKTTPEFSSDRVKDLVEAEKAVLDNLGGGVIIRSGGQYGADRYPARFLAKKDSLSSSLSPVNVIHQHDLCRVCDLALKGMTPAIVHAVSNNHATKEEFYGAQAHALGLKLPPGDDKLIGNKIVQSEVLNYLSFEFEKGDSVI